MKILQLNKAYFPVIGGVETVVQEIAQSLQTDVLCCNNGPDAKTEIHDGYTVYKAATPIRLFSTPLSFHFVYLLFKLRRRYDILHVHHPDPMSALALFLVRPKGRIIVHWHSDIVRQKWLLKLYSPLQNWLLKRSERIIATTPSYIEASPYLFPYRAKCVAIPIGIPQPNADLSRVEEIRKQYAGKTVVFSLGRFVYYKGFEYLIRSAHELDDSYVIVIGGDGPLREEMQTYINHHGLQKKVFLPGKIDDRSLGAYFAACDLFCLSSVEKTEAFGIVQLEAMSFAKPVIATKIEGSGVSWVNEDGKSGLNVPVKDPGAIAEAIKKITKNSNLYGEMSHNARQRYLTHFTLTTMIANIQTLYNELYRKDQ